MVGPMVGAWQAWQSMAASAWRFRVASAAEARECGTSCGRGPVHAHFTFYL